MDEQRRKALLWLQQFQKWATGGFKPNDPNKPVGPCPDIPFVQGPLAVPFMHNGQVHTSTAMDMPGMTADEMLAQMNKDLKQAQQHLMQYSQKSAAVAKVQFAAMSAEQLAGMCNDKSGRLLLMQELASRFRAIVQAQVQRCANDVLHPNYVRRGLTAHETYSMWLAMGPLRGVQPRPVEQRHQLEI